MFHADHQSLMLTQTEFLEGDIHHQLRRTHVGNGIGAFKVDRVRRCRLIEENRVIFARLEPTIVGLHLVDLKPGLINLFE